MYDNNSCAETGFNLIIFQLNKSNSLRRSWFDLTLGSNDSKTSEQERWSTQTLKYVVESYSCLLRF